MTPEDRADLLKIKEERDAKKKGDKISAQVSVVALGHPPTSRSTWVSRSVLKE